MANEPFGGQGAANGIQNVILNLQNLVLAVNALTAQAKVQFGESAVYKVATLPAAGQPGRAFVSDSTVVAAGNFGATVVGAGTHTVPVYFDNLTWKIG
jgi:hypothetical protein